MGPDPIALFAGDGVNGIEKNGFDLAPQYVFILRKPNIYNQSLE